MHINRLFLFALMILLIPGLLILFSSIPSPSSSRNESCFEPATETALESMCEGEEELEETELLCCGLFDTETGSMDFPRNRSKRLFFAPPAEAAAVAIGWSMPLLI